MMGSRRNAAAHCRRTELPVQKFRCVRRGGYQPPGDFHWKSCGTTCRNMPRSDIMPPNFIVKCSMVPLSAHCADVVSPMGKQPGG